MKKIIDLSGKKFGKLSVLNRNENGKWNCICDCGNICEVISANLKKGNSKSCGCTRKITCSKRISEINFKHGMHASKVYYTWEGIISRTTNKNCLNYARYGAKGIGISKDWRTFENFYRDVGNPPTKNHSIERIDNNIGYEVGNVKWATAKEQAINRRTTRYLMVDDEKLCFSDAAKKLGFSKTKISRMVKSGKLISL